MTELAERLSRAGWPETLPPVEQLEFIDQGFGTEVYGVPGSLVVRVARTSEAGSGLVREAALLRRLSARLPAKVASPLWAADSGDDFPHGALALTWVGGTTPADTVDTPPAHELVEFLVALHSIPLSVVGDIALPDHASLAERRRSDGAFAREIVRSRWSRAEAAAFDRWLARTVGTLLECHDPVIIHGDYWYGNLRVHRGCLWGVLDWEDAALTDGAVDLGPLLYLGLDAFDEAVREYSGQRGLDQRLVAAQARASCEARELSGIRLCVEANDLAELESELVKLHAHL